MPYVFRDVRVSLLAFRCNGNGARDTVVVSFWRTVSVGPALLRYRGSKYFGLRQRFPPDSLELSRGPEQDLTLSSSTSTWGVVRPRRDRSSWGCSWQRCIGVSARLESTASTWIIQSEV